MGKAVGGRRRASKSKLEVPSTLQEHLCLLEQRQLALQLPPVMFASLRIKVKPAFNIQQIISILKLSLIPKYLEKG